MGSKDYSNLRSTLLNLQKNIDVSIMGVLALESHAAGAKHKKLISARKSTFDLRLMRRSSNQSDKEVKSDTISKQSEPPANSRAVNYLLYTKDYCFTALYFTVLQNYSALFMTDFLVIIFFIACFFRVGPTPSINFVIGVTLLLKMILQSILEAIS